MNLVKMPERQRLALRKKCLRSLYCFCVAVMGYDDIIDTLHGDFCRFLEKDDNRKQATMPRSYVKTWIGSIAFPIWASLLREEEDEFPVGASQDSKFWKLGPNMRVLIASYVISNAEKMIALIRKTYEANSAMQILFPEVIPYNFNKTRWSNQSACINRSENFTESTFEAAGIGGASTSRHYDLIIEDDLIYAKKDDFTDQELQPSQDDIDQAIGWHKLATSLLVPGKHTRIHNAGTRWARHDLVDYIWTHEKDYAVFARACVSMEEMATGKHWRECTPEWPECYDVEQLDVIARSQGPYMFSTQYLLLPMSPEELLFKREMLQMYISNKELPKTMRKFTTIDLAGWGMAKRSKDSRVVVLTCGWCDKNHMWLLHYDVGRFDPTQVIELMAKHWRMFKPEMIGIEAVYYQKAIHHFAHKAMEEGKIPWMTIRQLMPEGSESKEVRIRALEPIATNLALHCKPTHIEFIDEFCEYVPKSDSCKKDILDAAAYQIRIARPGEPMVEDSRRQRLSEPLKLWSMDEFIVWAQGRNNPKDRFGNPLPPTDPYNTGEEVDFDMLAGVTDPFYVEQDGV